MIELKTVGSNTRKHHYISACYLKNFASPKIRTGKIYSLDKENKKQYQTTPDDSGCERDFNRIDSNSLHPNALEDMLGKTLENDFPKVVEYIEQQKKLPGSQSQYYSILITL